MSSIPRIPPQKINKTKQNTRKREGGWRERERERRKEERMKGKKNSNIPIEQVDMKMGNAQNLKTEKTDTNPKGLQNQKNNSEHKVVSHNQILQDMGEGSKQSQ